MAEDCSELVFGSLYHTMQLMPVDGTEKNHYNT